MHKRAFQGLKCSFMQVSGLPPPYFDKKLIQKVIHFFNRNMLDEDLRHS